MPLLIKVLLCYFCAVFLKKLNYVRNLFHFHYISFCQVLTLSLLLVNNALVKKSELIFFADVSIKVRSKMTIEFIYLFILFIYLFIYLFIVLFDLFMFYVK